VDSLSAVTLDQVVKRLDSLDRHATIYAARPWLAGARAAVALEPEDGDVPAEADGLEYFLEVAIALEVAAVAPEGRKLEAVIYYAENDAFLPGDGASPLLPRHS
jgi:hypothetical protein